MGAFLIHFVNWIRHRGKGRFGATTKHAKFSQPRRDCNSRNVTMILKESFSVYRCFFIDNFNFIECISFNYHITQMNIETEN